MTWRAFLIAASGALLLAPELSRAQPQELPGLEGTGITGSSVPAAQKPPRRRRARKRKPVEKKAAPKKTSGGEPAAKAAEKTDSAASKPAPKPRRRQRKYPPRRRPVKEPAQELPVELAAPQAPTPAGLPGDAHRNKRYSFEVPRGWRGPLAVPGGVRYQSPGGTAHFAIAFHKAGTAGYKPPADYRRWMREQGSIADSRTLDPVRVSQRLGSRARWTTPEFGGTELFGEVLREIFTEQILVPDPDGIYVVEYAARKAAFEKHRLRYIAFLRTLELPYDPRYAPSEYYRARDHLVEPLLDIRKPAPAHVAVDYLIDERFQMGFGLGAPSGFSFRLFYVLNSKWTTGIYFGLAKIKVGDVATSALGLQTRYYFKDPMQSGWFLCGDLALVKAGFEGGPSVVEEKAAAFVPGLGLGYQRFWDFFTAEGGLGFNAPSGIKQTTRDAAGQTSTVEHKMPVSIFVSGSYRF